MKKLNLFLLSFFYILNGIFHFAFTDSYLPIMPDFFPYHWELILFSGILEFVFGIGVLFEKVQKYISLWNHFYINFIYVCSSKHVSSRKYIRIQLFSIDN